MPDIIPPAEPSLVRPSARARSCRIRPCRHVAAVKQDPAAPALFAIFPLTASLFSLHFCFPGSGPSSVFPSLSFFSVPILNSNSFSESLPSPQASRVPSSRLGSPVPALFPLPPELLYGVLTRRGPVPTYIVASLSIISLLSLSLSVSSHFLHGLVWPRSLPRHQPPLPTHPTQRSLATTQPTNNIHPRPAAMVAVFLSAPLARNQTCLAQWISCCDFTEPVMTRTCGSGVHTAACRWRHSGPRLALNPTERRLRGGCRSCLTACTKPHPSA